MFFLVELIVIGVHTGSIKFLIYFSHLGLVSFTVYTVWSAGSVTAKFLDVHIFRKEKFRDLEKELEQMARRFEDEVFGQPKGCCGVQSNNISWYQRVHWLLFIVGTELALGITILQWLYQPSATAESAYVTNEGVVLNIVKGIVPILDSWFTDTPVRILHGLYLTIAGAVYVVFHGVYFSANGTDINESRILYTLLDYEQQPGATAAISAVFVLVYLPLVHLGFFVQHLLRKCLIHLAKKKCHKDDQVDTDLQLDAVNIWT